MSRPSGFTLLEVMLAIVLTGLVVLLAYGAAQVSYDAQARLRANIGALQEARALRELLQDALRSARAPQRPGDPRFTLHAGRLSFVTAGGGPPIDPDYDWLVTIEPGADGLEPDRKSTRLNSSHGYISYAVFCLKKKKTKRNHETCNQQKQN